MTQPRDNFDMDHQDNPILADVEINGERRKVVYVLGKPGILWAFDRETGTHLWHRQLVAYQNLYKNIDPQTGAITMNEEIIPTEVGTSQLVCPGMRGGKPRGLGGGCRTGPPPPQRSSGPLCAVHIVPIDHPFVLDREDAV